MHERELVGLEYLRAATALLQRARRAHPTFGLFEAADLQWWWAKPRSTDPIPQLVWFDDDDQPVAAVIVTDWGERIGLDPLVMPDAPSEWLTHVFERGLAHATQLGYEAVGLEVDRDDGVLREVVARHGFDLTDDGVVETWLAAGDRPTISPLHEGYRLTSRAMADGRPHHMIGRSGPDVEARLRQASLYRPDLDLAVVDADDRLAAHGMFWFDPATATGLVEPIRTEEDHQRRGLGRHVLTRGIDLLARAGATRVKICFEPGNPAARRLYLSVGFRPDRQTDTYTRLRS